MDPSKLNLFDMYIGIEKSRPLVCLIVEGLLKYEAEESSNLNTIFINYLKNDQITATVFEKLNIEKPASENSLRNLIRCGLLILDNEVGHQLIFILTGFDLRGIIICANFIAKDFSKIILKVEELSELEEGYVAYILNEELFSIKSIIDNK